jgi:uncharacterized SAM-binding protein YcdF (DUF218 family)
MWLFLAAAALAGVRSFFLLRHPQPRTWQWWLGWAVPLVALAVAAVTAQDLAVQKLIGRLVMPLGLLWLALWAFTAWQLQRRQWQTAIAGGILALLCSAFGNEVLGARLIAGLQADYPAVDLSTAGPFDAVFVCGGGTGIEPGGRAQLGDSGDRLLVAVSLWRQGRTPLLVASSSNIAGVENTRDLAAETAAIWHECGVPAEAIIRIPGPRNTSEEIARYHAETAARHWRKVAVISSAWHLPRIAGLCRREGFEPTLIGADYQGEGVMSPALLLVPTASGASSVQTAAWELLGRLVGR